MTSECRWSIMCSVCVFEFINSLVTPTTHQYSNVLVLIALHFIIFTYEVTCAPQYGRLLLQNKFSSLFQIYNFTDCDMGNEMGTLQMDGVAFDQDEIKRLGKRFKKLDLDGSGSISIEEFMSLPELQQNPLVRRVIDIFDDDNNGEVDFKEFIQGLSHFSAKGNVESKLKFAFR